MKKLIVAGMLLAACRSSHAPPPSAGTGPLSAGGNTTGAPNARAAVLSFLGAAKAEDLQAMAAIWGTNQGPARDVLPRDQLEKRELIMIRCFQHDSARILGQAPGTHGTQVLPVELRARGLTGSTNFIVVPGPKGRWYVEDADIAPLKRFCARP